MAHQLRVDPAHVTMHCKCGDVLYGEQEIGDHECGWLYRLCHGSKLAERIVPAILGTLSVLLIAFIICAPMLIEMISR